MLSESKITEIYCMADNLCKEFSSQQGKYMIEDKKQEHRITPSRMSQYQSLQFIVSYRNLLFF